MLVKFITPETVFSEIWHAAVFPGWFGCRADWSQRDEIFRIFFSSCDWCREWCAELTTYNKPLWQRWKGCSKKSGEIGRSYIFKKEWDILCNVWTCIFLWKFDAETPIYKFYLQILLRMAAWNHAATLKPNSISVRKRLCDRILRTLSFGTCQKNLEI